MSDAVRTAAIAGSPLSETVCDFVSEAGRDKAGDRSEGYEERGDESGCYAELTERDIGGGL